MNDRWQEIERIYHQALEMDKNVRAEFMAEARAGDLALRVEVESLLAQTGRQEAFLAARVVKTAARGFG
ncbi:MAG TPA: hypothetical protein VGW37_14480 [Terriglobia bacterium]|nr:hypothetical protein [Terriglobia bacterium]